MIATAYDQNARCRLLLEVTLEAEGGAALGEHLAVHRTVGLVAGATALTNRLVFENERTHLRRVALPTGITLRGQLRAAAPDGRALVGIVAITATHLALQDRMVVRQGKLAPLVEVAFEARLRIAARVQDVVTSPASLRVQAARAMTTFAAELHGVGPLGLHPRVGGGVEVADRFRMALGTVLIANKFGSRNGRRRNNRAGDCRAGHHRDRRQAEEPYSPPAHDRSHPRNSGLGFRPFCSLTLVI